MDKNLPYTSIRSYRHDALFNMRFVEAVSYVLAIDEESISVFRFHEFRIIRLYGVSRDISIVVVEVESARSVRQ